MKTHKPDQGISSQVEDLPQSDHFQWEAVPATLSGTNSQPYIRLSAQSPDITQTQPEAEVQRASQAASNEVGRVDGKQVGQGVSVNEEHIQIYEKEDFAAPSGSGTIKRKGAKVS